MESLNVIRFISEVGSLLGEVLFTKDNVSAEINKALQAAPMQPHDWVKDIYTVEYPAKTPAAIVDGSIKPISNNYGAWAGNTLLFRESVKCTYAKSTGTRADYEDPKYWNLRTAPDVEKSLDVLKPYMDRYKKLKEVTDAFIEEAKANGILDKLVTHVFYIRTYASVKAEADKKAKEKADKEIVPQEYPADSTEDIDSVPHDELMENSEEVEDAPTAAEAEAEYEDQQEDD
jgi:hypothetical protein